MPKERNDLPDSRLLDAKIALTRAEAKRAEAEAHAAEWDAKLKQAEARQKEAHALSAIHGAESMRVQTEATLRQEKLALASNHYYHEFEFSGSVTEGSVGDCLAQLALWHRLEPGRRDEAGVLVEPGCDMHIIMDSPGGSVIDGMHLLDQLTAYSLREWDTSDRPKGTHKTTITVRGYAASMAGILLQAADERVIGPESFLMVHQVSSMAAGKIDELKDEIKFLDKISDRVVELFVTRSNGKMTKTKFTTNWKRQDWWLTSSESLANGFVDRIG